MYMDKLTAVVFRAEKVADNSVIVVLSISSISAGNENGFPESAGVTVGYELGNCKKIICRFLRLIPT